MPVQPTRQNAIDTATLALMAGKTAYEISVAQHGEKDIAGSVWATIPGDEKNQALVYALTDINKGDNIGNDILVGADDFGCSNTESMCHEEAACAAFLSVIRRAGFAGWLHSEKCTG